MDLEEQTLHYYSKIFRIFLIIFFILIFYYFFNLINKNILLTNDILQINKSEKIEIVFKNNIKNYSDIDIFFLTIYSNIYYKFYNKFMHYGEFYLENNSSINDLLKIISKPSNILNKITIIEGWSKEQLNKELSKHFSDIYDIQYDDIIADTYFFEKNKTFNSFVLKLNNIKENYFKKFNQSKLLEQFSDEEIMTIGSLLEKEGLGYKDKQKISSVIFNRLNANMKLQIDATVIYSITQGNYNFNRKLLISDLNIDHPYNTYKYYGLPPKPISYVGKKTLEIIFENNKTDFLFYFFDNSLNRHIFSKTYKDHKKKLNEYRNK